MTAEKKLQQALKNNISVSFLFSTAEFFPQLLLFNGVSQFHPINNNPQCVGCAKNSTVDGKISAPALLLAFTGNDEITNKCPWLKYHCSVPSFCTLVPAVKFHELLDFKRMNFAPAFLLAVTEKTTSRAMKTTNSTSSAQRRFLHASGLGTHLLPSSELPSMIG